LTASNPFPMPWLMSADRAARLIAEGVARGVSVLVFPWQMCWAVWVLRVMPPWLFDRVVGWTRVHRPQVFRRSGLGPQGPAP
jgi:hypothetical protein